MEVIDVVGAIQVTDEIILEATIKPQPFVAPALLAVLKDAGKSVYMAFYLTAELVAKREEYVLVMFYCLCQYFAKNNIEKDVRVLYQVAQDFVPKDL